MRRRCPMPAAVLAAIVLYVRHSRARGPDFRVMRIPRRPGEPAREPAPSAPPAAPSAPPAAPRASVDVGADIDDPMPGEPLGEYVRRHGGVHFWGDPWIVASAGVSRAMWPRIVPAVRLAEILRARLGGAPMRVVSAYRSPAANARAGGAPRSTHMEFAALDLAPVDGTWWTDDPRRVAMLRAAAEIWRAHRHQAGGIGFGIYEAPEITPRPDRRMIHYDSGRAARHWSGDRGKDLGRDFVAELLR